METLYPVGDGKISQKNSLKNNEKFSLSAKLLVLLLGDKDYSRLK